MTKYKITFDRVSSTVYLAKNTTELIARAKNIVDEISSTITYEKGYTDRLLYIIAGRMISTEFLLEFMNGNTIIDDSKTITTIQVDGFPNDVTVTVGYMVGSDKTNIYVNGINIL